MSEPQTVKTIATGAFDHFKTLSGGMFNQLLDNSVMKIKDVSLQTLKEDSMKDIAKSILKDGGAALKDYQTSLISYLGKIGKPETPLV